MQFLVLLFHLEHGWLPWLTFLVGGIIGLILVTAFLDWALIILSSLAGSSLVIESIHLPQVFMLLAFIGLVIVGISVQARDLKREKR